MSAGVCVCAKYLTVRFLQVYVRCRRSRYLPAAGCRAILVLFIAMGLSAAVKWYPFA